MNKTVFAVATLGLLLLSILTALTVSSSNIQSTSTGNTLYVGGSGPGNYSSIQDAIDNASDGDTVFVYNGIYFENIEIRVSNLSLIGQDKKNTIIDGEKWNSDKANYDIDFSSTSEKIIIKNFTIKNGDIGICLRDKNSHLIENNVFINNTWGLSLGDSYNNILKNNIFKNNSRGIAVTTGHNYISNNSFFNDGLYITTSSENFLADNTLNNNPLLYLSNKSNIDINTDAGQIILYQCQDIKISNKETANIFNFITVINSKNCEIINNKLSNISKSIILIESDNCKILNNNITNNGNGEGIYLKSSSNNIISENNILNSNWGIYTDGHPSANILKNNLIKYNKFGFFISSNSEIISDNIISNNNYGIYLRRDGGNSNIINRNLISNNKCGIHIGSGLGPGEFGCSGNIIYLNNFINNSENTIKECGFSDRPNRVILNYYDDYEKKNPDAHKRILGIWNEPYKINEYSNDKYPLTKPYSEPMIFDVFLDQFVDFCRRINII